MSESLRRRIHFCPVDQSVGSYCFTTDTYECVRGHIWKLQDSEIFIKYKSPEIISPKPIKIIGSSQREDISDFEQK